MGPIRKWPARWGTSSRHGLGVTMIKWRMENWFFPPKFNVFAPEKWLSLWVPVYFQGRTVKLPGSKAIFGGHLIVAIQVTVLKLMLMLISFKDSYVSIKAAIFMWIYRGLVSCRGIYLGYKPSFKLNRPTFYNKPWQKQFPRGESPTSTKICPKTSQANPEMIPSQKRYTISMVLKSGETSTSWGW